MPDREVVTVSVKKSANADEVYDAIIKKIGMSKKVSKYFYIFEIVEYNFGEYPLTSGNCSKCNFVFQTF